MTRLIVGAQEEILWSLLGVSALEASLACPVTAGTSKGKDCMVLSRWGDLSLAGTSLLCVCSSFTPREWQILN